MKLLLTLLLLAGAALAQQPVVRLLECQPATGSGTAYACTIASVPSGFAYTVGVTYWMKADVDNTGAATVNFNGLGAKNIVKMTGGASTSLGAGDIHAGQWVQMIYDGANMQMQSQLGNGGGAGGVTSVSFTGGLITVGSPTTTPALTVAGTSGGVVYFNGASTWASSAALAAGQFVLGGGAGSAPTTSFSVVPVANGGTGNSTNTAHGVLLGEGSSAISAVAAMGVDTVLQGQGATSDPVAVSINNCANGLTYSTSTHAFGCLAGSPATVLSGTTTLSPGSLIDGGVYEATFTLSGAVAGEATTCQWPSDLQTGILGTCLISATNTVKIRLLNMSGISQSLTAAATYGAKVFH